MTLGFSRSSTLMGQCDGEAGKRIKIKWDKSLKTQGIPTKFFKDVSSRKELLASDKVTDGRGLSLTRNSHLISSKTGFHKRSRNSDAV